MREHGLFVLRTAIAGFLAMLAGIWSIKPVASEPDVVYSFFDFTLPLTVVVIIAFAVVVPSKWRVVIGLVLACACLALRMVTWQLW